MYSHVTQLLCGAAGVVLACCHGAKTGSQAEWLLDYNIDSTGKKKVSSRGGGGGGVIKGKFPVNIFL